MSVKKMSSLTGKDFGKNAAAKAALDYIQDGMKVGLGTGTTAACFISYLGERCRSGLKIEAVATSLKSSKLAEEKGIPIIDIASLTSFDVVVDGADEIDPEKRLIKGGGGALFREKIVAKMGKTFIVIADESKKVEHLGKFPLAVEILPFGYRTTVEKLKQLGYSGKIRALSDKSFFITDNGNYIFDISLSHPCLFPESDEAKIRSTTGVVETGFFIGIAKKAIIGYQDGHTEIID